jgi:hypothetical protein
MGYFQNDVYLLPATHQYFSTRTGLEYKSVSKLFEMVKKPFDSYQMSLASAGKRIREDVSGKKLSVDAVAAQLRQEWKDTAKRSTDHGTRIHEALELFGKTATIPDKELDACVRAVYYMLKDYPVTLQEEIVYSDTYGVAGMMDKPCLRTRGAKSIIDIVDYKTNVSKGITYSSKYGKWFNGPLSHLEECSYNEYSVKLSVYAVMLEELGYRVGNLALIYIDPFELDKPKRIPIPYMKMEALSLLKLNVMEQVEVNDDF